MLFQPFDQTVFVKRMIASKFPAPFNQMFKTYRTSFYFRVIRRHHFEAYNQVGSYLTISRGDYEGDHQTNDH